MITNVTDPRDTHNVQEFILTKGRSNYETISYSDLSYIYNMNGIEYIVRNILDDYMDELLEISNEIKLDDWAVREYRYNPKKLSNRLYNTTQLWYMILKVNGLANVHEFTLENQKLLITPASVIKTFLSKVYSAERQNIQMYQNSHVETSFPQEDVIYRPNIDTSQKFFNI